MSDFKSSAAQSVDDSASSDVPAWQERRNQIALAALGAIAVVGLGVYFLLIAGGSDEDLGPVASPRSNGGTVVSSPAATASPSAPAVGTKVPAAFEGDTGRDPFAVLYPPLPSAPATSQAATPVTVGVGSGAPGGENPASAPVVDPVVTTESVKLKLVRIVNDDTAIVRIDGRSSETVTSGEMFGEVFEMSSTRVDDGEATFKFGDGERFTLAEGDSKTVVVRS
jgi:hypothetical protein